MRSDFPALPGRWRRCLLSLLLIPLLMLGACARLQPLPVNERHEAPGMLPALAYYQSLPRLGSAELARERTTLAGLAPTPNIQIRQAMLFGHPRAGGDAARALSLVDGLLKSSDPAAVELQPLARLLADHYAERLRLDGQLERQGGQLKESQRKAQELQDKLDSLADIERTLKSQPRAGKGGRQ